MEKSLNQQIKETFAIAHVDIRTYSPLTLAYIGDGIFDVVIRSIVVGRGNTPVNQLHHKTSHIVKAHSQAMMAEVLLDEMTDTEKDIYRRGRNAKSHTMAKNATVMDYRCATGFEALMGYLYLTDEMDRILELISIALERCDLL
ncbi:MAG: ribonuclease III [Pseudobutyrivibrio sp.]|nr:ribonuclease III [Pseudobutyrivibrio sp.]